MPTEIINNLWFGNEFDINDNFLLKKDFDCLIICNKFIQVNKKFNKDILVIPIENHINNNDISDGEIFNIIIDTIKYINNRLIKGENIFISCKTGQHCSPMLIAIYLKKYGKITSILSIKYILSKKSNVFKNNIKYLSLINNINKLL